jgi:hypothetical protein
MNECRHGLNEEWCASCRKTPARVPVFEGTTIASRFGGKCPGCGELIVVGEDVHLTDVGWVCTRCKEAAA